MINLFDKQAQAVPRGVLPHVHIERRAGGDTGDAERFPAQEVAHVTAVIVHRVDDHIVRALNAVGEAELMRVAELELVRVLEQRVGA